MNFTADIVLDDADGTDVTYRRIGSAPNGSKWIDVATTLAAPATMEIIHSQSGKGSDIVDRHVVRFARTIVDSNGVPRTLVTTLTNSVPRSSVITNQVVFDQNANLLDFMSDQSLTSGLADTDAVASLLRGES